MLRYCGKLHSISWVSLSKRVKSLVLVNVVPDLLQSCKMITFKIPMQTVKCHGVLSRHVAAAATKGNAGMVTGA